MGIVRLMGFELCVWNILLFPGPLMELHLPATWIFTPNGASQKFSGNHISILVGGNVGYENDVSSQRDSLIVARFTFGASCCCGQALQNIVSRPDPS